MADMTEKERREKGLPPSPAQLALVAEMQKNAEAQFSALAETMHPALDSIARMQETPKPVLHRPAEFILPIPPRDRTVRIAPDQFNELVGRLSTQTKVVEMETSQDLVYDFKEKTLTRTVPGMTLVSRFNSKSGEAKRMQLLERLIRHKKYLATKDLREELECPSGEAVRKLVQGINNKVKKDLSIKFNIIEGRSGFGYRINSALSIHTQK